MSSNVWQIFAEWVSLAFGVRYAGGDGAGKGHYQFSFYPVLTVVSLGGYVHRKACNCSDFFSRCFNGLLGVCENSASRAK